MTGVTKIMERLAGSASRFLSGLAALILFVLVVHDLCRCNRAVFFSMPVVGAVELVRICMAGIIFFSLPAMFFRNIHVCVDLITMLMRGRLGWIIGIVMLIVSIYVAWRVGDRVFDYWCGP